MIEYALCWDLLNGEEQLKSLFQKFQKKKSNTIYKNLYDFHVLEKPSMCFDKSKMILNKLKKINKISWVAFSYRISKDEKPRISINLILTPLSFFKILINGYYRNPLYSLTIAAHDTKNELINDYEIIMQKFFKKKFFFSLYSSKLSLIEYESGKWEKWIE